MTINKIKGCLFGMAIGDGFGYPTEFLSVAEILEKWSPSGPKFPEGNPILVTDDTQMALAVATALTESIKDSFSPNSLESALRKHFVAWLNDPQNNRAPGMTCLTSCEKLEKGLEWEKATAFSSKGCGANMRVAPVALLKAKGVSNSAIAKIAQFQSAITHAHPTALVASELTAMTIVFLLEGVSPTQLLPKLLSYAESQKLIYHQDYLNNIWDRPPMRSPEDFIQKGWEDCIQKLIEIQSALEALDTNIDPCLITGEGWIAEEAFATALLCFLYFPKAPVKVLQRAVLTSGDSDSIACLAGAFIGTHCGFSQLPQDWTDRIEYKNELLEFSTFFNK